MLVAVYCRQPTVTAELSAVQASFDPPGLSIAVKKDRAVETLLVNGNKFNVNVLARGHEKVRISMAGTVQYCV